MSYRDLIEIKECARCGSTEGLEVHHMNLNHDDDTEGNHLVLCRSCHHNLHYNNWKLEDIGIKTPKISYNAGNIAYYTFTTADIQRELEEMGDPVTDIIQGEF